VRQRRARGHLGLGAGLLGQLVAGSEVLRGGPVGDDGGAAGLPVHRHRDALEALLLLELLEHVGLELADGLLDALGRKPGVAAQSGVHVTLLSRAA
jgi:hypothetical protein